MTIIETQEGGTTREYTLSDCYRDRWVAFFEWLVKGGVIVGFEIRN